MITKQQAMSLSHNEEIHHGECSRVVGPRGGHKDNVQRVRPNGRCQTWKTRPKEFRLPIKYGLYGYGAITEVNAKFFHLASKCKLNNQQ